MKVQKPTPGRVDASLEDGHSLTVMIMRPLSKYECTILAALADDFVSTLVVKVRAGISSAAQMAPVLDACFELERRGLAEHTGSGLRSSLRWRRKTSRRSREIPHG